MYLAQVLAILALFTAAILNIAAADGPEGRLLNGQPIDNLRQFPHHVYIVVAESGQRCGGTILSNRWVLTSASCVKHGVRIELYFRKQQQFDIRGDFFSISVNRDQVFVYPTNYDDIALIKIPTSLDFSESLSSVNISRLPIEALRDRFTVMPGFSDFLTTTTSTTMTTTRTTPTTTRTTPKTTTMKTTTLTSTTYRDSTTTPKTTTTGIPEPPTPMNNGSGVPQPNTPEPTPPSDWFTDFPLPDTPPPTPPQLEFAPPAAFRSNDEKHFESGDMADNLRYGMFSVVDSRICKKQLGNAFDEYNQLCVNSWGGNPNRPCDSDFGSGLIVGWPARSELVGLFSMASPGCDSQQPAVFTFIGKYLGWIEGMMRG